jgi:hypothetical protein
LIARKEELEARKRKITNMKRAAKKSVASTTGVLDDTFPNGSTGQVESADLDLELDVLAESESLRAHTEQWKR